MMVEFCTRPDYFHLAVMSTQHLKMKNLSNRAPDLLRMR